MQRSIMPDYRLEVFVFAGSGSAGLKDGKGREASFSGPCDICHDAMDNCYVADFNNHAIRKITPDGVVTLLAGSGQPGFADGLGAAAQFSSPRGICCDPLGVVYVADSGNNRLRRITQAGMVTTFCGSATRGRAEGVGQYAQFDSPYALTLDSKGVLYVADYFSFQVRGVTTGLYSIVSLWKNKAAIGFDMPTEVIKVIDEYVCADGETFPLAGGSQGDCDGVGASAKFNCITGVGVDSKDNLYVCDYHNHKIRKITQEGVVTTFAGSGSQGYADGRTTAKFYNPYGVKVDKRNDMLYVADCYNHRIRRVNPRGVVTTFCGAAQYGMHDASRYTAKFFYPYNCSIDSQGNGFVADLNNHAIRKCLALDDAEMAVQDESACAVERAAEQKAAAAAIEAAEKKRIEDEKRKEEEVYQQRLAADCLHLPVKQWSGDVVLSWLKTQALAPQFVKYIMASAANIVDGPLLLSLDDRQLRDCGVSNALHRRRLLAAVAAEVERKKTGRAAGAGAGGGGGAAVTSATSPPPGRLSPTSTAAESKHSPTPPQSSTSPQLPVASSAADRLAAVLVSLTLLSPTELAAVSVNCAARLERSAVGGDVAAPSSPSSSSSSSSSSASVSASATASASRLSPHSSSSSSTSSTITSSSSSSSAAAVTSSDNYPLSSSSLLALSTLERTLRQLERSADLTCSVCARARVSVRFGCAHVVCCERCAATQVSCPRCGAAVVDRLQVLL